jgi:hypothetical protein
MAELKTYFATFLENIRPPANQREDCKAGHETLRKRLHADEKLKDIVIESFLQGSYRRYTAVKPNGDKRSDVDVIAVTSLDKNTYTPRQAMDLFVPFLNQHYKDKWHLNGRSFGISLSYVELDLVITATPDDSYRKALADTAELSETDMTGKSGWQPNLSWVPKKSAIETGLIGLLEAKNRSAAWQAEPLDIPDREIGQWDMTHPLAQIAATWEKGKLTDGHYVNVVKAVKWWKLTNHPDPKYPKGYPVEHLVWVSCPDYIGSVAEGVTRTLEAIASEYQTYADLGDVPIVSDHGVPSHNVLGRLSAAHFQTFHKRVCEAAKKARKALDCPDICESADLWRELFGNDFPKCTNGDRKGGYTPREGATIIGGGRFA